MPDSQVVRPSADLNQLLDGHSPGDGTKPATTEQELNGAVLNHETTLMDSTTAPPSAATAKVSTPEAQGELTDSGIPVDQNLTSIDGESASVSEAPPAKADAVDLLSAQADELSLTPGKLELSPVDERPPTPLKDEPKPQPQEMTSPPPPPPPPKDVLPKDAPPRTVPAKDEPSEKRLSVAPPLTPIPSRSNSPTSSSPFAETPREKPSELSSDDEAGDSTRTEIHDLFQKSHRESLSEEQLQLASSATPSPSVGSPLLAETRHPPRTSSLSIGSAKERIPSPEQPAAQLPPSLPERTTSIESVVSGRSATVHRPPPPDKELPFDFHRFLAQLRHRSADPVAKFLRSFLHEFSKKQWAVNEQVKIVQDFLYFINGKMDHCEVWREVGDVERDNAREGMEKLVMNRLYSQTFSPAIDPPPENGRVDERFPGRRGLHQEDVERDEVLAQKIRIYSWIREEHLDIGDTMKDEKCKQFLNLAVKEMLKIGSYRAPRDKVICVLNCCKVIFGWIRYLKSDESADKFVPLLIYVVLRANPAHLVSNVQYILRFRNPDKLSGEAGYYLSSLAGAISFIENLDQSSLTITSEEFEANVEAAVAAIAERSPPPSPPGPFTEKPRPSSDAPRISTSSRESNDYNEPPEDKAAVAGLLRSIQKPLSTIGRIFSDESSSPPATSSGPVSTPRGGRTPGHSPHPSEDALLTAVGGKRGTGPRRQQKYSAEEAAARQASAEAEEARRIGRMEYENVVNILKGMFPALDGEVIGDVVRMKEGRVGLAVDACLALGGQNGFA